MGKVFSAIVKIAAKEETVGKDNEVAQVRIHILKYSGSADIELMKATFVSATELATGIPHSSIYFPTNAVAIVGDGVLSLEFHILPSQSVNVRDSANVFVNAVADPTSQMYGGNMEIYCPIDISFRPDVSLIIVDPSEQKGGGGRKAAAIMLPILAILIGAGGLLWLKRKEAREWMLRKLARMKFQEMDDEDREVRVNTMHPGGGGGGTDILGGVFGSNNQPFQGIRNEWNRMKQNYLGGAEVGYDDLSREGPGDVQLAEMNRGGGGYSIGEVDDENDDIGGRGGQGGMGFASGVTRGDEADIVRVAKAHEVKGNDRLINKKKVIQIEL